MARPGSGKVTGYSTAQVALHWAVVVLVVFQFVGSGGMERSWRAFTRGEALPADAALLANLHAISGLLILLFALARIFLRLTRGAPKPPADEPRALRILAEATHGLLYLLLLVVPLSGAAAWFAGAEPAAGVHQMLKNLLFFVVVLHVAGALFQHFVRRSDVLMRMLKPQRAL